MINFWASWCDPCRMEMPLLEDIYKKYKPMGFTMLAVNVEPDTKAADAWLGKLAKPVSFPIAYSTWTARSASSTRSKPCRAR